MADSGSRRQSDPGAALPQTALGVFGKVRQFMAEESEKLSPKQKKAIVALLQCGNVEQAAADAKIGARTLHRWLKEPHFRQEYLDAGERLFEQGITQLQKFTTMAAARVAQTLVNSTSSPSEQLRAADILLRHARPVADIEVNAKVRTRGQSGVLMVAGPISTEEWVGLYAGIEKYQDMVTRQAGESDSETAKPGEQQAQA